MHIEKFAEKIKKDGYCLVPDLASDAEVESLLSALCEAQDGVGARHGPGGVYAMRNLLQIEAVRTWAYGDAIRRMLAPILGEDFSAVRGILFDKMPGANWKVGWHQDLSIAVKERVDVPGFSPWSEKAGVIHVQPPAEVLEEMLTVRLHLDACDESNGPLRLVPASHLDGKLDSEQINAKRRDNGQVICTCPRGGALLMRPLLMHASSPATAPGHRRVVHIEFAAKPLPGGLEWC